MDDHRSPQRPLFLFAPGAGAPSSSRWMVTWRRRLETLGDVVAFDYPYMQAGRRAPDRPPALIAAHRAALAAAVATAGAGDGTRAGSGEPRVFLIGKSMGGRIGCHVAADTADTTLAHANPHVTGLICLGYPLRSGTTGALRDQVLLALRTPILFVQGTRDPLCPLDDLAAVRARMTAPHRLHVVEGGDHSLEVSAAQRKAAGETQADADARVLDQIRSFTTLTPDR
jgi:predicted alpha/beta-hydrolase family hydrolase